ncbi:MAG: hypothetical protein M1814_002991 [Vezdaea aestivalis]|nr:MAG: hypothetical protein M1814_002991 [Vezdaea aestivalis]
MAVSPSNTASSLDVSPRDCSLDLPDSDGQSTPLTDCEDYFDPTFYSSPSNVDVLHILDLPPPSHASESLKHGRSASISDIPREKRAKLDPQSVSLSRPPAPSPFESMSDWPAIPKSVTFLSLPPEIRNQIYELMFVRPSIRPVCRDPLHTEDQSAVYYTSNLYHYTSVLRSCKQIHSEATNVLYGMNNFIVYSMDTGASILAWVNSIGPKNQRLISRLELNWQHMHRMLSSSSQETQLSQRLDDSTGLLKSDIFKAIHDKVKAHCHRIADAIKPFRQDQADATLKHLTAMMPGQESPQHPNNFCASVGCPGCTDLVRDVMVDIKGLESLTIGDTEWKGESESLAKVMGVKHLSVTNMECVDFTDESVAELKELGWDASVVWRNPEDDDEYRRMLSKRLKPTD